MAAQELRDQIREAFPATQFYGPITSCDCEECTHIREELRHKRWDEISTTFFPDVGKWARCCRYGLSFLRRISAGEEVLVRGVSFGGGSASHKRTWRRAADCRIV